MESPPINLVPLDRFGSEAEPLARRPSPNAISGQQLPTSKEQKNKTVIFNPKSSKPTRKWPQRPSWSGN